MVNIMLYLRDSLRYLRNERGLETLEWILIGALITAVAVAVYPGTLQAALTGAIASISAIINPAVP